MPTADGSDLADRLRAQGIRVAIVDVTSRDVASGPFRVARAVSPDLMPITFGHGLERLPPDASPGLTGRLTATAGAPGLVVGAA